MKKLFVYINVAFLSVFALLGFASLNAAPAYADVTCGGVVVMGSKCPEELERPSDGEHALVKRVSHVIGTISVVIGIVCAGFIIYNGIRYMIALGNPGKLSEAKRGIIYAIVGLLIAIFARAIVEFVLKAL